MCRSEFKTLRHSTEFILFGFNLFFVALSFGLYGVKYPLLRQNNNPLRTRAEKAILESAVSRDIKSHSSPTKHLCRIKNAAHSFLWVVSQKLCRLQSSKHFCSLLPLNLLLPLVSLFEGIFFEERLQKISLLFQLRFKFPDFFLALGFL